jgi:YaiO family outer membrane protein
MGSATARCGFGETNRPLSPGSGLDGRNWVCLFLVLTLPPASVADPSSRVVAGTAGASYVHAQLVATYALTPIYATQAATYIGTPGRVVDTPAPDLPQSEVAPTPRGLPRSVGEVGARYYDVNEGFSDTYGTYARFNHAPASGKDLWFGEVAYLDRFDAAGTYLYYSTVSVGTSAGGFFWPSWRVDASISRRWLPRRNFVSTVGIGYFDAKDDHRDVSALVEGTYYFESPWIVQAGVRLNESDPGSVVSPSGYAAVTYGRDYERFVTLRYGTGQQGYEALSSPAFVVDFPFQEVSLTWREWVRPDIGFNLVGYGFQSDPYDQLGFELGVFKEF